MKTRQEYIETDYVDGVYDSEGNMVIRPLDKMERAWLSQFYAETEHGNFKKTQEIEAAQNSYNALCRKLRSAKKDGLTTEEVLNLKEQVDSKYKELVHLRAETNTFYPEDEDRKEIFTRDNRRREDAYNLAKSSNRLISYDLDEFDEYVSNEDLGQDTVALDYMVRKSPKKVIRRKKKI